MVIVNNSMQSSTHKEDIKPIAANLVPKLEAIEMMDKSVASATADDSDDLAAVDDTSASTPSPDKDLGGNESFFNETLELSQEDIQKTLSANMPQSATAVVSVSVDEMGDVVQTGGELDLEPICSDEADINPMDFINNCCDDGGCII